MKLILVLAIVLFLLACSFGTLAQQPTRTPDPVTFEQAYFHMSSYKTLPQDSAVIQGIVDAIHARGHDAYVFICTTSYEYNFYGEDEMCLNLFFKKAR